MSWKAIFEWLTRATAEEAKQDEAKPDPGPVVIVDPPSVTYPKPEVKPPEVIPSPFSPYKITPTPISKDGELRVNLGVVTIRDGRNGDMYDPAAILCGRATLMTRSKVRLDSGSNFDVPADEYGIEWRFYAPKEVLVGKFTAGRAIDDDQDIEIGPWVLGGQGIRQLETTKGHTLVMKWRGLGAGTSSAAVEVVHNGVVSNRIVFPKVD